MITQATKIVGCLRGYLQIMCRKMPRKWNELAETEARSCEWAWLNTGSEAGGDVQDVQLLMNKVGR